MNFSKKFSKNKGITLIALVVTIIVLLILAGISINMLTGQNGILNRAAEAKNATGEAQNKEELEMAISSLGMDYYMNGGAGTFSDYIFAHEDDLKSELGTSDVSLDSTAKTITYKGTLYSVATDGTITRLDGVCLSETTKTLSIVETEKEEFTLTATLTNISGAISWSTSNANVATVTGNGATATVKAVGKGTAEITASCSGKTATCKVTVKEVTIATTLSLSSTTITIDEGDTKTITATQNGTEEIEWASSDTSIATVTGSGDNNQTATITAKKEGTVTITAKTKNVSTTCTVTINSPYIDDSYVEYDVGYTDIYTGKEYTNLTGWRILNQKDNGDGTYDLDIISTGIPAGLYYHYNYITNATYSPWAGTDDQIATYVAKYYTSGKNGNANMYAASGLRYNFEKIKLKQQSGSTTYNNNEYNTGYYTKISKKGVEQTGEIDGTTFKARDNVEVRSVMHSDITGNESSSDITVKDPTDRTGLFILQNYAKDKHTTGRYWLGSPCPSITNGVHFVYCSGDVGSNGDSSDYSGLRPVVSMTKVKMQKKAENSHVWEILNKEN